LEKCKPFGEKIGSGGGSPEELLVDRTSGKLLNSPCVTSSTPVTDSKALLKKGLGYS